MSEQQETHICEDSFTLDGLCMYCWKVRAEKAEAKIKEIKSLYQASDIAQQDGMINTSMERAAELDILLSSL